MRLIGVIALSLLAAQSAGSQTLRDAMAAAYRNSDILEQNRFLLRLQDEGVAQRIAGLRPIIGFAASTTYTAPSDSYVSTLSLVGDLLLFDNGGSRLAVEAARATVEGGRYALIAAEQQVLSDAVTAYVNVWRDAQTVAVRESNVRVVTEQLRAARDRFEVGEDTRTDVAQAEARAGRGRFRPCRCARPAWRSRRSCSSSPSASRRTAAPAGPGPLPELPGFRG